MPSLSFKRNQLLAVIAYDAAAHGQKLTRCDLKQGQVLHDTGLKIDHVYFPLSGLISLVTVIEKEAAVENAMIGGEGAVGTKCAFGRSISLTRAVVQTPGTAVRVTSEDFQSLVSQSPVLREAVSRYNEGLVAQIQQVSACYATHKLEARIARWLLSASDRLAAPSIQITQERLALTLGVHRARLNTIMGSLQAHGAIRYERRSSIEIERERLQQYVCRCYGVIREIVARASGAGNGQIDRAPPTEI